MNGRINVTLILVVALVIEVVIAVLAITWIVISHG